MARTSGAVAQPGHRVQLLSANVDVLSSWHECLAFLLAVQGIFTGLATLVWMLVASDSHAAAELDDKH
jgi:hypothetical protein